MKLIELLNRIANGEEIKSFKFDEYIFKYDVDRENWKNENGDILSTYCNVEECLNDEVEILEDKKIEKLDLILDEQFSSYEIQAYIKETQEKVNEIIDKINED